MIQITLQRLYTKNSLTCLLCITQTWNILTLFNFIVHMKCTTWQQRTSCSLVVLKIDASSVTPNDGPPLGMVLFKTVCESNATRSPQVCYFCSYYSAFLYFFFGHFCFYTCRCFSPIGRLSESSKMEKMILQWCRVLMELQHLQIYEIGINWRRNDVRQINNWKSCKFAMKVAFNS